MYSQKRKHNPAQHIVAIEQKTKPILILSSVRTSCAGLG